MSYIGNQPFNASFITDSFSGTGSQTVYSLTVGPGSSNAVLVVISGVLQPPSAYSVIGQVLTFSSPPPSGSNNIVVRYLALPASSVTNSAYRSYTELTASAGQTTFAPATYTPGYIDVFRNGVRLHGTDYTATNGTTVVLANAANSGDSIAIIGFYVSSVLNAIPNTAASVNVNNYDVTAQGGTGAILIPYGTTSQRPGSPSVGMIRLNTSVGVLEWYSNNAWQISNQYTVQLLVVAGGGAGGQDIAGGGGGGGVYYNPAYQVTTGTSYTITIGSGGTRPTGGGQLASQLGGNSYFGPVVAYGGGGGTGSANTGAAGNGGNGGGAGNSTGIAGAGVYGQGNYGNATGGAAGGGGAGQSPLNSSSGSNGAATYITGSLTYYGGGGGGTTNGTGASGGLGGGGTNPSGTSYQNASNNGTTNTGGGGSGHYGSWGGAGNGGSGIVIVAYQNSTQRAVGGTVTSYTLNGLTYWVHTFLTSSSFTA
jgi:hypothetical protein